MELIASSAHQVPAKESDINEMRLEFIKAEILKKLKLSDVPNVGNIASLPLSLGVAVFPEANLLAIPNSHPNHQPTTTDNFAKTNEIILLPSPESINNCSAETGRICFGFDLPRDILAEDLNSAHLWIYKNNNLNHGESERILNFVELDGDTLFESLTQITEVSEGWIRLDFSKRVKAWLSNKILNPLLKIECSTCDLLNNWMPISVEAGTQPSLVLDFVTYTKKSRFKRNINCHGGLRECCREKLYVSFKDVGWDSWVIQPEGYHAYFCTGSCSPASAAASSASLNTSLRRKVFSHTKKVELIPCCAATQHSSMTLIYRVDNQTVTKKTLPNMVVESCGCM